MQAALIAVVATALYYVGVGFFKASAERMERLQGTRPIHLFVQILTDKVWAAGFVIGLSGFVLQFVALSLLPLSVAQPIFVATLMVALGIAFGYFGERLALREWLGLGTFAVATLLVALSVVPVESSDTAVPSHGLLLAVVIPSIILPVIAFSIGDLRPTGRHARPLAGVAYGLSSGVLFGTMELSVKGLSNLGNSHPAMISYLTEPYLYSFCVAAVLGLAQLQIALQRCRMAIVLTVCTVVAKTQLIVTATFLYGESWPSSPFYSLLRASGFVLGIAALAFFPRYEAPELLEEAGPVTTKPRYPTRHPA
jgi:drug/metabolite transporter (DMT)-like permease